MQNVYILFIFEGIYKRKMTPYSKGAQVRTFLTSRWGGWVSRLVRKSIKMSKKLFCVFLKIVYQGSFKAP